MMDSHGDAWKYSLSPRRCGSVLRVLETRSVKNMEHPQRTGDMNCVHLITIKAAEYFKPQTE